MGGTTCFPWGQRLCDIGPEDEPQRVTRLVHWGLADLTVSGAGLSCDGFTIKDEEGQVVPRLNLSAVAAGVRITTLEQQVGRHGPLGASPLLWTVGSDCTSMNAAARRPRTHD